jgi:hypothetical protein
MDTEDGSTLRWHRFALGTRDRNRFKHAKLGA